MLQTNSEDFSVSSMQQPTS